MAEELDHFLEHYGVKGMKWGQRKTKREASKDAKEYARAQMFYGEGAGNRRKLIKATVEAKASKHPGYKDAFDAELSKQDMGKHASKAQKERRRKDTTETTLKTARGVHRSLNGGFGNVSLLAAVVATSATAAHKSGVDKMILDAATKKINQQKNKNNGAEDWLRKNGFA